ncbi:DUF5615 family PIN-like protein [Halobaculum roseum]|uniref:DUF5615 family PIN-like protein n=1 Tax=Halobaculum roseum TaxID=2175149 RepID=A0ABD5MQ54_9EURY|nr:DUF5615 family PIN-like protein [Halobaculum roseum]QZY01812.1 DUF5615 family PIN-like protein [Halobaculum roseum]
MSPVLYLDESIWAPVADGLRQRGRTVHTAHEEETAGHTDREQLRYARDRDWTLVTFDDDFLSLVEGDGLPHEGIVYIDQRGKRVGDVVRDLDTALEYLDDEWEGVYYA